ncbi:Uncharacterised protein [Vibrio cholerae]|nr:Uncharacterised protein [Vibrio cholerae]
MCQSAKIAPTHRSHLIHPVQLPKTPWLLGCVKDGEQ